MTLSRRHPKSSNEIDRINVLEQQQRIAWSSHVQRVDCVYVAVNESSALLPRSNEARNSYAHCGGECFYLLGFGRTFIITVRCSNKSLHFPTDTATINPHYRIKCHCLSYASQASNYSCKLFGLSALKFIESTTSLSFIPTTGNNLPRGILQATPRQYVRKFASTESYHLPRNSEFFVKKISLL
jgi:hypothetical protein